MDAATVPWHVRLLGGFEVSRGQDHVRLSPADSRVPAYLALRGGSCPRRELAGTLWPEGADERAGANLRTALWRLQRDAPDLVYVDDRWLRLGVHVVVDVDTPPVQASLVLLPDWSDEWLVVDRERIRQKCLHEVERLTVELVRQEQFGDAMDFALQLVAADPLRESAHRLVIAVHLAEGNLAEARRYYAMCSRMLAEEVGSASSELMEAMARAVGWSVPAPRSEPRRLRPTATASSSKSVRPGTHLPPPERTERD